MDHIMKQARQAQLEAEAHVWDVLLRFWSWQASESELKRAVAIWIEATYVLNELETWKKAA